MIFNLILYIQMMLKQVIYRFGLMLLLVIGSVSFVSAQDEISDQELTKYVHVMDSIDILKREFGEKLNNMVRNKEGITTKRYNEIRQKQGAPVTENEQKLFDEIVAEIKKETKIIQEKSQSMIKSKEMLGATIYNKVRKALRTDQKSEINKRMKAIRESDTNE